jgi:DedD protein
MHIAVKERLVGAAVLVVIVVLVVPALLSGPRPPAVPAQPPSGDTRVVEIDLSGTGGSREVSPPGETADPAPAEMEPDSGAQPASAVAAPAAAPGAAQPATPATAPVAQAQEAPAPVPASAGGGWAVQVAALSRQDAAEQMVARLKGKGYPAYVLEHRSGGQVLYRVRVGPEVQRERAESLAGRLRDEGFNPAVVSQP